MRNSRTGESRQDYPGAFTQAVEGQPYFEIITEIVVTNIAECIVGIDPVIVCNILSHQKPELPVGPQKSSIPFTKVMTQVEVEGASL